LVVARRDRRSYRELPLAAVDPDAKVGIFLEHPDYRGR
jgi:hypothetical protein